MEIKALLQNRYVQLVGVLLLGITIGALFYPTKSIEERVERETSAEYEKKITEIEAEHKEKEEQLQEKVASEEASRKTLERETSEKIEILTTENRQLKESTKKKRFKLVKPDGTIIEKEYEESNREEVTSIVTEVRKEFDEKIKQTEDRWKKAYRERLVKIKEKQDTLVANLQEEHKIEIEKLKSEKVVKVNEKKFRTEIGYTTDNEVRVGGSYKLWGPISIGGSVDIGTDGIREGSGLGSGGEVHIGFGFEF